MLSPFPSLPQQYGLSPYQQEMARDVGVVLPQRPQPQTKEQQQLQQQHQPVSQRLDDSFNYHYQNNVHNFDTNVGKDDHRHHVYVTSPPRPKHLQSDTMESLPYQTSPLSQREHEQQQQQQQLQQQQYRHHNSNMNQQADKRRLEEAYSHSAGPSSSSSPSSRHHHPHDGNLKSPMYPTPASQRPKQTPKVLSSAGRGFAVDENGIVQSRIVAPYHEEAEQAVVDAFRGGTDPVRRGNRHFEKEERKLRQSPEYLREVDPIPMFEKDLRALSYSQHVRIQEHQQEEEKRYGYNVITGERKQKRGDVTQNRDNRNRTGTTSPRIVSTSPPRRATDSFSSPAGGSATKSVAGRPAAAAVSPPIRSSRTVATTPTKQQQQQHQRPLSSSPVSSPFRRTVTPPPPFVVRSPNSYNTNSQFGSSPERALELLGDDLDAAIAAQQQATAAAAAATAATSASPQQAHHHHRSHNFSYSPAKLRTIQSFGSPNSSQYNNNNTTNSNTHASRSMTTAMTTSTGTQFVSPPRPPSSSSTPHRRTATSRSKRVMTPTPTPASRRTVATSPVAWASGKKKSSSSSFGSPQGSVRQRQRVSSPPHSPHSQQRQDAARRKSPTARAGGGTTRRALTPPAKGATSSSPRRGREADRGMSPTTAATSRPDVDSNLVKLSHQQQHRPVITPPRPVSSAAQRQQHKQHLDEGDDDGQTKKKKFLRGSSPLRDEASRTVGLPSPSRGVKEGRGKLVSSSSTATATGEASATSGRMRPTITPTEMRKMASRARVSNSLSSSSHHHHHPQLLKNSDDNHGHEKKAVLGGRGGNVAAASPNSYAAWQQFVAAAKRQGFSEPDLCRLSWGSLRGLLTHFEIHNPVEVAHIQLEWTKKREMMMMKGKSKLVSSSSSSTAQQQRRHEGAKKDYSNSKAKNKQVKFTLSERMNVPFFGADSDDEEDNDDDDLGNKGRDFSLFRHVPRRAVSPRQW